MIAQTNERARRVLSKAALDDQLATNAVISLEVLYSAGGDLDHRRIRKHLEAQHDLGLSAASQRRAVELQALLAIKNRHRIPITDLLIAADAEQNGVQLLHYDSDFDLIAKVSSLDARWIVPRGSGH